MDVLETTYVSKTNQPTNQQTSPTPPNEYLSVRITAEISEWDEISLKCKFAESWYITWAENGKSGTNPHFHVLLPGTGTKDAERIRNRLKRAGYSGNQCISVKLWENGILQGISIAEKKELHTRLEEIKQSSSHGLMQLRSGSTKIETSDTI